MLFNLSFTFIHYSINNFIDISGVSRYYYKLNFKLNSKILLNNIKFNFYNFNGDLNLGFQAYVAGRGLIEDLSYIQTKSNLRFEDYIIFKGGSDFSELTFICVLHEKNKRKLKNEKIMLYLLYFTY